MKVLDKEKRALSLRHFLTSQEEEEKPADQAPDAAPAEEETAPPADEETEEEEQEETSDETVIDDSTTVETEETSTEQASADLTETPATASISVAELDQLRADAAQWNEKKAHYATLEGWYNTQKRGAALPAKDASDATGTKRSWEQAPWNQA